MIKPIIEKEREKNARRIETRLKENRSEQQTSVIVVYKQAKPQQQQQNCCVIIDV